jgi:hypothetical protein
MSFSMATRFEWTQECLHELVFVVSVVFVVDGDADKLMMSVDLSDSSRLVVMGGIDGFLIACHGESDVF